MVSRTTIITTILLLISVLLWAAEFYKFPTVTTVEDRDIYLLRRPAAAGFDNQTGTRNITGASLLASFRVYTAQRRAVLRQGATFKNMTLTGKLNVAGGITSLSGINAGNIVLAGEASLVNGEVIGKRLASYGTGHYDHFSSLLKHRTVKTNPHSVTAAQIGLTATCANRVSYDGLDGSLIYTFSGTPDNATGKKTDVALNTLTGDFYRKDSAAVWTLKGNIKGVPGNNGADGTSATISIGTVTALPYGSAPYVNNVGSSLAALLDFGLVTGQTGAAGSPDTQAQILTKIATPTDGAKLTMQQGATEAGTDPKIEVRDAAGNLTGYIPGNGSIVLRKGGNTLFTYNTATQGLNMYRGNGTTPTFSIDSTGRIRGYRSLTL